MAAARLFDILGVMTVFVLVSTLNVVQGSVIADDQLRKCTLKLTELEDKVERCCGIKAIIDDVVGALISGNRYHVADTALTSSGSWRPHSGAPCSRIGVLKTPSCPRSAWLGIAKRQNQWIQVDLGRTFEIQAVTTQGRGDYHHWVTSYKLASFHGSRYLTYKAHGRDKIFQGNFDQHTLIRHALVPPIQARYVRLYPITWHGIAMRWELYGKPAP